jgi:hypothetical protein
MYSIINDIPKAGGNAIPIAKDSNPLITIYYLSLFINTPDSPNNNIPI